MLNTARSKGKNEKTRASDAERKKYFLNPGGENVLPRNKELRGPNWQRFSEEDCRKLKTSACPDILLLPIKENLLDLIQEGHKLGTHEQGNSYPSSYCGEMHLVFTCFIAVL